MIYTFYTAIFIFHVESHDHAMDVGFLAGERFVVPAEGSVSEVDFNPRPLEERFPHRRDGFPLADGVGRDEGDSGFLTQRILLWLRRDQLEPVLKSINLSLVKDKYFLAPNPMIRMARNQR